MPRIQTGQIHLRLRRKVNRVGQVLVSRETGKVPLRQMNLEVTAFTKQNLGS
jgi:hypothetical protein